jgi:protein-L-isoaspartate(D-aspartate) O-methyltransferase
MDLLKTAKEVAVVAKESTRAVLFLFLFISLGFLGGCQSTPRKTALVQSTETRLPSSPATPVQPSPSPADEYTSAREQMVEWQIQGRGLQDPAVLEAMRTVPRHEFVPDKYLNQAYADHPLPIGYGQTISQPYIVALMTKELALEPRDRVLEVGTGSGYQAAVLAEMDAEVYSIEIIPELANQAQERLQRLGYTEVEVKNGDGYYGWEEHAPYDAIIVTAAPDHLPQPLVNQLKEGGRLVIPIGPIGAVQTLWLYEKTEGEIQAKNLGAVQFVPLTGEH